MTLDQSALLELSEMMQTADGGEVMRRLLGVMVQALVDAEATAYVGAEPYDGSSPALRSATAPARRPSPRPLGT